MGFKGSLESINLADIFQNLALNQQSGTLRIQAGSDLRYVYFRNGAVRLFSRGKHRGNRLGEMVVGRGLAGLDQVEQALQRHQGIGRPLGDIMVEMGILSGDDLNNLIRYQIEEDVYELFFLTGGEFEFVDGEPLEGIFDPEQEAVEVAVNTSNLIMEAARRLDEWDKMKELVPSTEEIFLPQPALTWMASGGELEPLEARLLDFLDGSRDVETVVEESSFSRFEVMRTLLGFLERGLVRSATMDDLAEAGERCRREGRTRHVIKIYERILAKGADTPEIRARLAEAATELGEIDKAAIHYGVLAQYYLDPSRQAGEGAEDLAVNILQKIVKLIPKHVPSRKLLAEIFSARGDVATAVPHYVVLVQTLFEETRLQEAERYCMDALTLDPENLDILQVFSRIHLARKQRPEAAGVLVKMADILLAGNRTRAAEEMLRRALLLDAANEPAKEQLRRLEEAERASRARPTLWAVSALLLLLLLASVVAFVFNELRARAVLAAALEGFKRGDLNALLPALARPSLRVNPLPAVTALVTSDLERRQQQLLQKLHRQREEKRLADALAQAQELFRRHQLAEARSIGEPVSANREFPQMAAAAQALLKEIERVEADFRNYREWLKQNESNPRTLREEHRVKTEFAQKYPWSAEAAGMRLPLYVTAVPAGADVFVGGRFVGPSPYLLYYRAGERFEVEVRKRGFAPARRTFLNPGADEVAAAFNLERAPWWTADCEGAVELAPVIVEDMLLVANRTGAIRAFDRRTGRARWSHGVSKGGLEDAASPLAYYAGSIYFGSMNNRLRCVRVSPAGAENAWVIDTSSRIAARCVLRRLALLNNQLFVFAADGDGTVYCVQAETGALLWSKKVERPLEAEMAVTDRTLYVADIGGGVTGFDVTTGRELWRLQLAQPAAGFVQFRNLLVTTAGRDVIAFPADERPDNPLWTYTLSGAAVGLPSIVADRCFVADTESRLYCIEPAAGKPLWSPPVELDAPAASPVAGDRERCYIADAAGNLYAFEIVGRQLRWKYQCRRPVKAGCLALENTVYTVTRNGTLYAFEDYSE